MKLLPPAIFLILCSSAAHAQNLPSLVQSLLKMSGTTPVRATLDRQVWNKTPGQALEHGRTSVIVEMTSAGLSVIYPTSEIRKAEAEARETDPEKPKPTTSALSSLDAVDVGAAISFSGRLLHELEGARLIKDIPTSYRGQPSRLLEMDVKVRLSKAETKHVRQATSRMKLWLGADGTPVASETTSSFKARFLVVTFEGKGTTTRQFARNGDRLLVMHEDSRNEGSGFGQSFNRRTVTTLRLE